MIVTQEKARVASAFLSSLRRSNRHGQDVGGRRSCSPIVERACRTPSRSPMTTCHPSSRPHAYTSQCRYDNSAMIGGERPGPPLKSNRPLAAPNSVFAGRAYVSMMPTWHRRQESKQPRANRLYGANFLGPNDSRRPCNAKRVQQKGGILGTPTAYPARDMR
jgi:hypothetical protein